MAPVDPPRRAPGATEGDPYEADESEVADADASTGDIAALRARADVPELLALAKAYRTGTAAEGRDMARCLEAYRAAAELGSAEAEYAVALFLMNGGAVVAQDLKEGAMRLRSAAERGSVPAKVYLGNLYELGIHYKADAEKADVWYRNAARGAKIDAAPGSEEWGRGLAELGSARHVLALAQDPGVSDDEKARLLARAKAHGHGLRIRDDATPGDRATLGDALAGADSVPELAEEARSKASAPGAPGVAPAPKSGPDAGAKAGARGNKPDAASAAAMRKAAERRARASAAFIAFGYALLFAVAGVGAGYAATLGARELIAHGHVLPGLGNNARLVFPIVLAIVGVLPAWLVYKLTAVLEALAVAAPAAGIGWVAWGTGQGALHHDRPLQALAFALVGFLAALFVLGLRGGTKQRRPPARAA